MPPKSAIPAATALKDDVKSLLASDLSPRCDDSVTTRQRLRDKRKAEVTARYQAALPIREQRDPARRVICNLYHQQYDSTGPVPLVKTLCEGAYYNPPPGSTISEIQPHRGLGSRVALVERPSQINHDPPTTAVDRAKSTNVAAVIVPTVPARTMHAFPQDDLHDHWGKKVPTLAQAAMLAAKNARQRSASSLQRCSAPIPIDKPNNVTRKTVEPRPFADDASTAVEPSLRAKPLISPLPLSKKNASVQLPEDGTVASRETHNVAAKPALSADTLSKSIATPTAAAASAAVAADVSPSKGRVAAPPVHFDPLSIPKVGRVDIGRLLKNLNEEKNSVAALLSSRPATSEHAARSASAGAGRGPSTARRFQNRPSDTAKFLF